MVPPIGSWPVVELVETRLPLDAAATQEVASTEATGSRYAEGPPAL